MQEMDNVADTITRHAQERPWAVAILDHSGAVPFVTFDRLMWAAAWHLRRAGVRPGDVVGLSLPHSALYLIAFYALARMGAIAAALPLSDPQVLRERLAKRFGVSWILGAAVAAGVPGIPTIALSTEALKDAPAVLPNGLRSTDREAIWNIRRTSGTTGDPKAIARTHAATFVSYDTVASYYPVANQRTLAVMDFSTAFGMSTAERSFHTGGAVVIAPPGLDAAGFLAMIDRYAITHVYLTANFLSVLLPLLPAESCRCPGLQRLLVTGMAMPESLRAEIRRRFTPHLAVMYGSNEAHGVTMADPWMQEAFPETVGRALPGVELEIVDDEDRPLPVGGIGHVRARSAAMPSGYFDAESDGSTFRNGWIYLGDLGTLTQEGMLFLKGRSNDMMIFDGVKIWPVDIEEALRAHPAVAEAAAFPIPDERHQHLPVAAVLLRQAITSEELLEHCRKLLGIRAPVIVTIETSFPRNAVGKVLRTELAARLQATLSRPR